MGDFQMGQRHLRYVKRASHEGVSGTKYFYWVPSYGIRSRYASFHHFSQRFYIREMATKAGNECVTCIATCWRYLKGRETP